MPFLFSTEVKDSPINGVGLFATENIPKGATVWIHTAAEYSSCNYPVHENIQYTKEELETMEDKAKLRRILFGGYYHYVSDLYVELLDGGQFTNHLDGANTLGIIDSIDGSLCRDATIALKDIAVGEEITQDYGTIPQNEWVMNLLKEFAGPRYEIEKEAMQKIA